MKVTRQMVAERAGVSPQTVSYYWNGTRRISPRLSARIDAAVAELGYAPDMIAASLAKGETRTIGVVLNDVSNPLDGEILQNLELAAAAKGYSVSVYGGGHAGMERYVSDIVARRADGLYIMAIPTKFTEADLDKLLSAGIRVLASVNRCWKRPDVAHIDPDFAGGMAQLVTYLSGLGHRQIAYLSAFDGEYLFDNRRESFLAAAESRGVTPLVVGGDFPYGTGLADGYRYAKRLLESKRAFTAAIATNDVMAFGAIRAFSEAGLSVPGEISVAGIDDNFLAAGYIPSLTTLGYDKAGFAGQVFDMLYAGIKRGEGGEREIPMKLIVRESMAAVK